MSHLLMNAWMHQSKTRIQIAGTMRCLDNKWRYAYWKYPTPKGLQSSYIYRPSGVCTSQAPHLAQILSRNQKEIKRCLVLEWQVRTSAASSSSSSQRHVLPAARTSWRAKTASCTTAGTSWRSTSATGTLTFTASAASSWGKPVG